MEKVPIMEQIGLVMPTEEELLPGERKKVPLGGKNIPESMPTVYDQEYIK